MTLCVAKKMAVQSEKQISKVLIIADASRQVLERVLVLLQTIRKDHLQSVRIIFVSFLSETLKKNLGPNILGFLAREKAETLANAKEVFGCINTAYNLKVIIAPPWKTVLEEIGEGNHDLLMLRGEFLDVWREYATRGCPYREMIGIEL